MTATPTAATPTPEELARTADLRASLDMAYAIASPTGAANHLAAWANNHGKALLDLAEAQRAEIERLTEALDDVQTAYCNHVMQQPDANAIAQSVADYGSAEAAVKGLHDFQLRVHRTMIDHFKARATTAEAALAAMTAERDRMREALERIAKGETVVYDADDLETDVITTMGEDEMREIARGALQPQETADVR